MTNLLLFGATILVVLHIAGSVLDAREPGDFSVNVVLPAANEGPPGFCAGTPSTAGSNCIAVSSNRFFAVGAEAYVVTPMMQVADDQKYRMLAERGPYDAMMGVTAGHYLVQVRPALKATITDGSFLTEVGIVEAAGIPVLVGAAQNDQGAFSWILNGLNAVQSALGLMMKYLILDYPMFQSTAAPMVFLRFVVTSFQAAFIIIVVVYGVRLIRGAG